MRTGVCIPEPYNKSGIPTNAWFKLVGLLGLVCAFSSDAQTWTSGSGNDFTQKKLVGSDRGRHSTLFSDFCMQEQVIPTER